MSTRVSGDGHLSSPAPGSGAPSPGSGVPSPGSGVPSPGSGVPSPGSGAPSPGPGVPSPGPGAQESSWIGLLSRPAASFLQRYLQGRPPRSPGLPAGFNKTRFAEEEREFLRQLEDMMPAPHLTVLRCQRDGAAGLMEPGGGGSLPWFTADSLREMGIDTTGGMDSELREHPHPGYLSSVRTFFSHALLSQTRTQTQTQTKTRTWWGSLWGGEEDRGSWSEEGSSADPRLSTGDHQDHGYSSLEEELFRGLRRRDAEEEPPPPPPQESAAAAAPAAAPAAAAAAAAEGGEEEEGPAPVEGQGELAAPRCQNKSIAFIMGCPCSDDDDDDDSSSQSDESEFESDADDDDDGFDSEGSSDLSESTGEDSDDEAERLWSSLQRSVDPYDPRNFTARLETAPRSVPGSTPPSAASTPPSAASTPPSAAASPPDVWDESTSASEADEAESARLWSSFGAASDPYSPLNFQAALRTRGPGEGGPGSGTRSKKASQTASPTASQTATQTATPTATPTASQTASPDASQTATQTASPTARTQDAEDRLDSGFSEPSASRTCSAKRVRFCDRVDEFFASGGEDDEDRRGPWEELARDRCRFLRRCHEVEESIGYCLQPQHRRRVRRRLAAGSTAASPPSRTPEDLQDS